MGTNNSIDFIRKILDEDKKYRNVEANFRMVLAACTDLDLQPAVVKAAPISTAAEVRGVIESLARAGKLGINLEYATAIQGLWDERPELRLETNEHLLIELVGDDLSADNLIYIASQDDVAVRLATTITFQRAQQEADAALAEANALAAEAAALQKELLDRYKDSATGRLFKTIRPREFAKIEAKIMAMDIDQLRADVAAAREKRRLAGLSKDDLRAEVRKNAVQREQQTYADRFPTMPKDFYPRGSFTPIPLNRQTLYKIAREDREFYRILLGKYGNEQLTARMQEQS